MQDVTIKKETIEKVFTENMESILKDVLTGYNSPVKKIFEEEPFREELKTMARGVFTKIIKSPEFQEQLKDKLLTSAVEGMLRR